MTITLAIISAVQTVVIGYGLEKFYSTWSRSWVVVKTIFNLLKSKLTKGEKEPEEKKEKRPNDIQLKIRKSSLKRFGVNTINCVC